MAPLNLAEKEALVSKILQSLANTPYACSSLTQLTNGTTNFVYRGSLTQPLPDEGRPQSLVPTVIIKHSTEYAAVNKDLPLDVLRSTFEETMLHTLENFVLETTTAVKTPRLLSFDRATTQILEDFDNALDLKSLLVSPTVSSIITPTIALAVGHSLGAWLSSFHRWASAGGQAHLRETVGQNDSMRKLKCQITYSGFIEILEHYPELVHGHENALRDIQTAAVQDFERPAAEALSLKDWGIIHGDFWSGNILIPIPPWQHTQPSGAPDELYVVDWEFAQVGSFAFDIGQMISDLYERQHFQHFTNASSAIQGFIEGYGGLDEDTAFKAAIHTGVHLVCWFNRRDRRAPLPAPEDVVVKALRLGRDFMLRGWEKDRQWFAGSILAPLFAST